MGAHGSHPEAYPIETKTCYSLPFKKTEMTSIQRHVSDDEMQKAIQGGITFKGAKLKGPAKEEKVKTKAKKKTYITGTHDELLAKKGAYAEMFEIQAQYYKEGKDYAEAAE